MYITFRRYKVDLPKAQLIVDRVNEGFVPILMRSVGFISYSLFCDEKGYICSVSTFTTRAGMEEANDMAIDWVKEHLDMLLPTKVEVYEGESLVERARIGMRF